MKPKQEHIDKLQNLIDSGAGGPFTRDCLVMCMEDYLQYQELNISLLEEFCEKWNNEEFRFAEIKDGVTVVTPTGEEKSSG